MPVSDANGIRIHHDQFGDPGSPTVLLVSGLGAQCLVYEDEVCEQLAAHDLHVVRYDNRDVGLSTHLDGVVADPFAALMAISSGMPVDAPYTLSDMAADGMSVLDVLGIDQAHIFGASMGGMIAQTMAIEHPERVLSLTSLMSTTGEPEVGQPDGEVLGALLGMMSENDTHEARVASSVVLARLIGTRLLFDEQRALERAELLVSRSYDPAGVARQLVAIFASGSRAEGLAALDLPTVVLHGDADLLVDISGGRRTAELVPGAEFRLFDGMAHDMPPEYRDRLIAGIVENTARAGV